MLTVVELRDELARRFMVQPTDLELREDQWFVQFFAHTITQDRSNREPVLGAYTIREPIPQEVIDRIHREGVLPESDRFRCGVEVEPE